MDLGRAIFFGTIYTICGFLLALLFLHLVAYVFFGQTAIEFLQSVDAGRVMVQQQYQTMDPGGWVSRLLSDKIYFSLIAALVLIIWWSNVQHQINKEGEDQHA